MLRTWWIFTFGIGQEHGGKYVRIWGTYSEARAKMVKKYGNKWAFHSIRRKNISIISRLIQKFKVKLFWRRSNNALLLPEMQKVESVRS